MFTWIRFRRSFTVKKNYLNDFPLNIYALKCCRAFQSIFRLRLVKPNMYSKWCCLNYFMKFYWVPWKEDSRRIWTFFFNCCFISASLKSLNITCLCNPTPLPYMYMPQGDRKACTPVGEGSEHKHSYFFLKIKQQKKSSRYFFSMIWYTWTVLGLYLVKFYIFLSDHEG